MKNQTPKSPKSEPEEGKVDFTQTRRDGDFDTLNAEDIIEQDKIHVDIRGDRTKLDKEMPRAEHRAQSIDLDDEQDHFSEYSQEQSGGGGGTGGYSGAKQAQDEPFNAEFHEMPENEQDESSMQTAIAMVSMYAGIKLAVPKMMAVSERKLKKMHKAGEINMYLMLPRNPTSMDMISVQAFVEEFNSKRTKPFETTDQFKSAVTPLLAKILKKNGLALTDTQLLIMYVAQDLAMAIQAGALLAADTREMLDHLRDMAAIYGGQPPVNRPSQPVPGNPPAGPAPVVDMNPQNGTPVNPGSEEKIASIVNKSGGKSEKAKAEKEKPVAV